MRIFESGLDSFLISFTYLHFQSAFRIYQELKSLSRQPFLKVAADGGALNVLLSCIELRCTDVQSYKIVVGQLGHLHLSMTIVQKILVMYHKSILKLFVGIAGLSFGLLTAVQKPDYRPHLEFLRIVRVGLTLAACQAFEKSHPDLAQNYGVADVFKWLQHTIE